MQIGCYILFGLCTFTVILRYPPRPFHQSSANSTFRLYVRTIRSHRVGLDDCFILAAWISEIAVIISVKMQFQSGIGWHAADLATLPDGARILSSIVLVSAKERSGLASKSLLILRDSGRGSPSSHTSSSSGASNPASCLCTCASRSPRGRSRSCGWHWPSSLGRDFHLQSCVTLFYSHNTDFQPTDEYAGRCSVHLSPRLPPVGER